LKGEGGGDPAMRPADFVGPDAPAEVAIGASVVPFFVVEAAVRGAIEFGVAFALGLSADEEAGHFLGGGGVGGVPRSGGSFMHADESKIEEIEGIGRGFAGLMDDGAFAGAIAAVGGDDVAGDLAYGPGGVLVFGDILGDGIEVDTMLGGYHQRVAARPKAGASGSVPAHSDWLRDASWGRPPSSYVRRFWRVRGGARSQFCRRDRSRWSRGMPPCAGSNRRVRD